MTIFDIDQQIYSLVDENGEILDWEAFEALQMERDAKIENTILWVKELDALAADIKEQMDILNERWKAAESKSARLKKYVADALDGQKFTTPRCEVTWRKSKGLEVEDADALVKWLESSGHDDCVNYGKPKVYSKAVTELIQSGVEVPFCEVKERMNMGVK